MKLSKIEKSFILNNYQDKDLSLFIFLMIILGIIPPAMSGNIGMNIWIKYSLILSSKTFNVIYLIMLMIVSFNMTKRIVNNYFYLQRQNKYKEIIINNIVLLIKNIIPTFITTYILVLAASIIFSFGDYQNVIDLQYGIPVLYTLSFYIIKFIIFYLQIYILYYLVYNLSNNIKVISTVILILHGCIYPTFYNFFDNILYEIIFNIVIFVINVFLYKIVIYKKRDLL